jgi:hypothetical protein
VEVVVAVLVLLALTGQAMTVLMVEQAWHLL